MCEEVLISIIQMQISTLRCFREPCDFLYTSISGLNYLIWDLTLVLCKHSWIVLYSEHGHPLKSINYTLMRARSPRWWNQSGFLSYFKHGWLISCCRRAGKHLIISCLFVAQRRWLLNNTVIGQLYVWHRLVRSRICSSWENMWNVSEKIQQQLWVSFFSVDQKHTAQAA